MVVFYICMVVFPLLIAGLGFVIYDDCYETYSKVITVTSTVLAIVLLVVGMNVWKNNTQSGKRMEKDFHSNYQQGINRTVKVFDINGRLMQEYEGKFDIETDHSKYILFDDQNGKRHIIYYTTGTILIDEK